MPCAAGWCKGGEGCGDVAPRTTAVTKMMVFLGVVKSRLASAVGAQYWCAVCAVVVRHRTSHCGATAVR